MCGFLFPDMRFATLVLSAFWLMLAGLLWGAAVGGGLTEGPADASGESGGECAAAARRQLDAARMDGGEDKSAESQEQTAFRAGRGERIGGTEARLRPYMGQTGAKERYPRRERLFLAGGMWLMARSMAEVWAGNAPLQMGSLPSAIVTALFTMAGLYLLGRGKLYPLWMAVLAVSWLLAGYLCSIAYAQPWQGRIMAAAVYLTLGGILVFQQIDWIRQELERSGREERHWEPLAEPGGFGTSSGTAARWHEAAWREYRQLRIFEHDFRHHLDIVAALYEEGSGEEARAYIGDLKQARETRQGRREGGERELSYIMMAKREACRQSDISFSYQIIGCPRGIAQMDMTALLLNLLDNAIRVCGEAPEPRSIAVMLLSRGVFWEIEMANAGHYEPKEERREELQDGAVRQVHGIGMTSVRQIIEKYQGTYRIWGKGDWYGRN